MLRRLPHAAHRRGIQASRRSAQARRSTTANRAWQPAPRNPDAGLAPLDALELACRLQITPGLTKQQRHAGLAFLVRLVGTPYATSADTVMRLGLYPTTTSWNPLEQAWVER